MAASPLNLKTSYHVRSTSLPSNSHPLTQDIEEQLYKLRSAGATSCSSSTYDNFSKLNSLYDSVEDLLQLPLAQKAIAGGKSNNCVNRVLDGSLRLLDICSGAREVVSQIREAVQELESAIRRRKEPSLGNEIGLYLNTRKKVNKVIQNYLRDLKKVVNRDEISSVSQKDHNLVAILSVLREVESISVSIFISLLSSASSSRLPAKTASWSFISKMIHTKRVSCDVQEANISEMEKVDIALAVFVNNKCTKGIHIMDTENLQNNLEAVQSSLLGLDEKLEHIYKSLIKTRVSLLNILSQ